MLEELGALLWKSLSKGCSATLVCVTGVLSVLEGVNFLKNGLVFIGVLVPFFVGVPGSLLSSITSSSSSFDL